MISAEPSSTPYGTICVIPRFRTWATSLCTAPRTDRTMWVSALYAYRVINCGIYIEGVFRACFGPRSHLGT